MSSALLDRPLTLTLSPVTGGEGTPTHRGETRSSESSRRSYQARIWRSYQARIWRSYQARIYGGEGGALAPRERGERDGVRGEVR